MTIEVPDAGATDAVTRRVVVALGSSTGDRGELLRAAVRDVGALDGCAVAAVSSLYETDALTPSGIDLDAPAYLNAVMLVDTRLDPHAFLAALQAIEHAHGRIREERWGPRTLDLDIIAFGDLTVRDAVLTIPHPEAHRRSFVLVPWLEIAPDAVVPGIGPVASIAAAVASESTDAPRLFATGWSA